MKNTIKQAVDSCTTCREDRPGQARPTAKINPPSEAAEPMRHVRTDLFDAIGTTQSYTLTSRYWVSTTSQASGTHSSPYGRQLICCLCTGWEHIHKGTTPPETHQSSTIPHTFQCFTTTKSEDKSQRVKEPKEDAEGHRRQAEDAKKIPEEPQLIQGS